MTSVPGVTEIAFPRALVNAFLVEADVPTLIDTGTPGGADKLLERARDAGVDAPEIGRILLTHRHADHAGNAAALARATGAADVKVALPWALEPVGAHADLTDGATVGPFRVIATPGHTAGHVSLLWTDRGVLFCGDAAANITAVGPHPASDDPDRARESFGRLADAEPEGACFGHGRSIASGAAQRLRAAR